MSENTRNAADGAENGPPEDLDEARVWATARLDAAGIAGAGADARRLVNLARDRVRNNKVWLLDTDARRWLATAVEERASRRPLSQISKRRDFYKSSFETGPDVLDPRPESEALVEAVLAFWPAGRSGRVLDLGVGSGCLLLSVLAERPQLDGLGIDASPAALALARRNSERLGLETRATFRLGDWEAGLDGGFDIVLSNPPYIPLEDWRALEPDVKNFEPKAALTPGRDGLLIYRRLASAISDLLAPGGRSFFEVGRGQATDVAALFAQTGAHTCIKKDLGGVERVVEAWYDG